MIKQYFKDEELACPCGCGHMPDDRSIDMLYATRIIMNCPTYLNSAARCHAYNIQIYKELGKPPITSTHEKGAFDIRTWAGMEFRLIQVVQAVGFIGLGFADNRFLHVDRYKKRVWGY